MLLFGKLIIDRQNMHCLSVQSLAKVKKMFTLMNDFSEDEQLIDFSDDNGT